jgi:hypothetical protein
MALPYSTTTAQSPAARYLAPEYIVEFAAVLIRKYRA